MERKFRRRFDREKISQKEFIEGANKDPLIKKSRRRISTEKILLAASGRLADRAQCSKAFIYIPPDLEEEIETYCSGTKQAVLVYLIRRGLEELIKANEKVLWESG